LHNVILPGDSWLEVSLTALDENLAAARRQLPASCEVIGVVKANAYGHGMLPIARRLRQRNVGILAVARLPEAQALRLDGDEGEILILGTPRAEYAAVAKELNLTSTVYTPEHIRTMEAAGGGRVHIKIETGMNRIGVRPGEELAAVLSALGNCPHVHVTGVFSHLCVADTRLDDLTALQAARFEAAVAQVRAAGLNPFCHLANTAAIFNHKAPAWQGARLGIGLYGLEPLDGLSLNPIAAWKTRVAYVKEIPAGESVGYGATYTADRPRLIATLPVGYADGYRRSYAPGDVLIAGRRCPLVGRVCMDQMMADVTGLSVVPGDEVVLLGRQGGACIPASELAQRDSTIHYEVMTDISPRVERRVIG